ncbi:MAG: hypothetical protein U5K37_05200 [Natrialbaceae archaeon]|nr:hypothetical protein [Natrialbaceae archaeon]
MSCGRVVAFTPLGMLLAWNLAACTAARQTRRAKHATAKNEPHAAGDANSDTVPMDWIVALTLALLVATVVARVATAWQALLFEWLPIWTGCLLGVWIGCQVIQGWRRFGRGWGHSCHCW